MRKSWLVAALLGCLLTSAAGADTFSTSALAPSPVPADGVIGGSYPQGGKETTYYLAVDLKAGDLATQIGFMGRPGRDKSLEIVLVDPSGRRAGSHFITNSLGANGEQARVLPVDSTGKHVLRITTKGPETTTFRVELGGTAFAKTDAKAETTKKPADPEIPFSRTFLAPTPVPADGIITGPFPMSEDGVSTHYYFGATLKAGQLATQLSFAGRKITNRMIDKKVELAVLNNKGCEVGGYAIMSGLDANQEASRALPIDNTGAYVETCRPASS
jgi:hypothetical protein